MRDYVHTADLAQAHQLAVETLEPGMGRVYNLGSGTGVTVLEVLQACEEAVGRPIAARDRRSPARRSRSPDRHPGKDRQRAGLVSPLHRDPRDRPDRLGMAPSSSPTASRGLDQPPSPSRPSPRNETIAY